MLDNLDGCDALVLECNHDVDMLAASRYPPSLKSRIGGRFGHLSNQAAADIVGKAAGTGLRHLVAAHLSRENNTPELARSALAARWGSAPRDVAVADPMLGFAWLQIG
jgi:phosphoribosyl 1,2-cyclic phosphodiesterase